MAKFVLANQSLSMAIGLHAMGQCGQANRHLMPGCVAILDAYRTTHEALDDLGEALGMGRREG